MITIKLNGELTQLLNNNLQTAIESWQMSEKNFAVAVNEQFVPRAAYSQTELKEGDQIELLVPMQGG